MAEEKCKELVENISNSQDSDVVSYLKDLNVLIESSNSNMQQLAALIPCELLFNCLKSSNEKQNVLCKKILKKILKFEKPDAVVTKYHDYVIEGMNHPSFEIRELCLSEVERCSNTVNGVLALVDKGDLLAYVCRTIADENLSCAQLACNTFKNLVKNDTGMAVVYQHQLQGEFNELLQNREVVRLRVFEMFIEMQKDSAEAFDACKRAGVFEKLLKELDIDDILVQMNCFELLTKLASSSDRGLVYLQQNGVMVKLHNMLLDAENNPIMELAIPGIIKFFGHLAHVRPIEVTQKYPQFIEQVYTQLNCRDPRLMPIAVETIGTISHSTEGLYAIFNNERRNKHIMQVLFNHVMHSESDLRLRALGTLALIFYTNQEPPTEDLSNFLRRLYNDMASKPLEGLSSVAKQPFEELRCGALNVLKSLSKFAWAQQDMVSCPGYLEYLLDRRTEPEKAGKELKYELIVTIVHSPSARQVFDAPYLLKLREYEREGPFFAKAQAAVAFEGAD